MAGRQAGRFPCHGCRRTMPRYHQSEASHVPPAETRPADRRPATSAAPSRPRWRRPGLTAPPDRYRPLPGRAAGGRRLHQGRPERRAARSCAWRRAAAPSCTSAASARSSPSRPCSARTSAACTTSTRRPGGSGRGCSSPAPTTRSASTSGPPATAKFWTPTAPSGPDSFYGLSKAYGELMGRLYWDKHGVENVNLRIGSCFPEPVGRPDALHLAVLRRPGAADGAVLEAPRDRARVIWGASNNPATYWGQDHRDRIGWEPRGQAETYRAKVGGKRLRRPGGRSATRAAATRRWNIPAPNLHRAIPSRWGSEAGPAPPPQGPNRNRQNTPRYGCVFFVTRYR